MRRLNASLLLVLLIRCCISVCGLYGPSSDVVQLSPSNFKTKVLGADGIVLVEFFAPWCGHCKNLVPAWEKAATALKGTVTVAALDADAHQSLAQEYGIKGFPTIKVFGVGKSPVDYQGPREARGIVDYALQQVKTVVLGRLAGKTTNGGKKKDDKGHSISLTSENFDELVLQSTDLWLVEFYAPWCGHCKKLAPEWKAAAKSLKGKVKLGQVDCDNEKALMSKYGVKGFPTILVFGPEKSNPSTYEGAREASAIESFALKQLEDSVGITEVVEVTGQDVLDKKCSSAAICFITFLPDILDSTAAGRKKYLETLLQVAEKIQRGAYSYLWVAAGKQPGLEKAVGVGGYGYPALVALNTKKGLYNALRGAFEYEAVKNFVKEAGRGGKGNVPLISPIVLEDTEAWDGKDGAPVEEDEFSLDELLGSGSEDDL